MKTTRFKIRIIGLLVSSTLTMLLALSIAGPAFATGCGTNCVQITGGTLSSTLESLTLNTSSYTLDGTNKNTVIGNGSSPLMQVVDSTGTGNGWNLQIKATQFSYVDGGSSTTYLKNSYITVDPTQFGDGSSNLAACDGSNSCTLPSDGSSHICGVSSLSITAPVAVNIGTDSDGGSGTNHLLCNAAAGTGIGTIDLYPKITLYLPGNVYSSIANDISHSSANTFSTTITLTTTSGPA